MRTLMKVAMSTKKGAWQEMLRKVEEDSLGMKITRKNYELIWFKRSLGTFRKNICSGCWERRNMRLMWNILFWWVWIEEERHKLFCFILFNLVSVIGKLELVYGLRWRSQKKKNKMKKLKNTKTWLLGVQYFWKDCSVGSRP